MHEKILASNWAGYEKHKTGNGQDATLFDGSELWEKKFLSSLVCSIYPQLHENTIKIAIAYCAIIYGHHQPREIFVERVMERVKIYVD